MGDVNSLNNDEKYVLYRNPMQTLQGVDSVVIKPDTKQAYQRHVLVYSHVYSISKISTTEQSFSIDMRIFMDWSIDPSDPDSDTWSPIFGSNIVVQNVVDEVKIFDESSIESSEQNRKKKNWKIYAIIRQSLHLHDFPIDEQTLAVKIRIPRVDIENIASVDVQTSKVELSKSLGIEMEWEILDKCSHVIITNPNKSNYKPEYHISYKIRRKCQFYLINIALPYSFFISICFGVYEIDFQDINSRLSLILTLLLTAVAFRYSTSTYLPVLSYMTALDKYTLNLFIILVITTFESMLACTLSYSTAQTIDLVVGIIVVIIYILHHIYWISWLILKLRPSGNAISKSE